MEFQDNPTFEKDIEGRKDAACRLLSLKLNISSIQIKFLYISQFTSEYLPQSFYLIILFEIAMPFKKNFFILYFIAFSLNSALFTVLNKY